MAFARVIVATLIALLFFPQEARVSGSAGFYILESYFSYGYRESARRKLRPDDYQDYFDRKTLGFKSVYKSSAPTLKKFVEDVKAAGIPLKTLDLDLAHSGDPSIVVVSMDANRGNTEIRLQVEKPLTKAQSEKLNSLAELVEFEKLEAKFNSLKERAEAKEGDFPNGVVAHRAYPKFTLAAGVTASIPAESKRPIKMQLEKVLAEKGARLATAIEALMKRDMLWVDPAALISAEEKFGKGSKEMAEENPWRTVFNFNGPLFDDLGRRTTHTHGYITYSILFLSRKAWNENDERGANRGEFESWFRLALEEPSTLLRRQNETFEKAFGESAETAGLAETSDARDSIGRLISDPIFADVGGSRTIEKLRAVVLDSKHKGSVRQREALSLLRRTTKDVTKPIFMTLVQSKQHHGIMGSLSQFATDCWDKDVVDTLFAIYRSPEGSDDDRSWAKNGLQTIRNKAESDGNRAMVKRIESELK